MPMLSRSALLLVATLVLVAGFGLAAHPAGVAPSPAPDTPAAPATFQVDPVHSSVVFKIGHLGVSHFWGRFNTIGGQYTLDPETGEASAFEFAVDVASVDTNSRQRDDHLKSPDFFNAVEHPKITFTSTAIKKSSAKSWTVTGDLSLHGRTKPITVDVHLVGADDTRQGYKSGLDTSFTIKRTDFGMDTYVAAGGLGDEVTLFVSIEGRRR